LKLSAGNYCFSQKNSLFDNFFKNTELCSVIIRIFEVTLIYICWNYQPGTIVSLKKIHSSILRGLVGHLLFGNLRFSWKKVIPCNPEALIQTAVDSKYLYITDSFKLYYLNCILSNSCLAHEVLVKTFLQFTVQIPGASSIPIFFSPILGSKY
jgi:hypothetical protein